MRKTPLILSILLHLSFFIFIATYEGTGTGSGKGKLLGQAAARREQKHVEIVPKVVDIEIKEVPPQADVKGPAPVVPPEPPQKKSIAKLHECEGDKWFGGIGIVENYMDDSLLEVASGYPAEKAGLRVGDKISAVNGLSPNIGEIRGEPGTIVLLTITRLGQTYQVSIIRGKICTDR